MTENKRLSFRRAFFVYLFFLVFIYSCGVGVRTYQHQILNSQPETILTTHDGYRWLRFAEEYQNGGYADGADPLSGLPEHSLKPPELPVVSFFTAKLSDFSGMSLEESGSWLTVFLSGLFIFPLGLLFYIYGLPGAGAGACTAGSLALVYLSRTSAFQIDTDMLNLFFTSSGALFLVLAQKRNAVLWSAVLGLTMYAFWRWYFHSGFTVVFFLLLLFMLRRKSFCVTALSALIYVICSSPFVFLNGFKGLLEFASGGAGLYSAPVAELQVLGFSETLRSMSGLWYAAVAGLVLSFFLGRKILPLAVFYLLGFMVFFKGIRYGIYLAPIYGAGLGFFADRLFRRSALAQAVTVSFLMIFCLSPFFRFVPPPVVSVQEYRAIKNLSALEDDAVIGALWDHGFMIQYLTGKTVFADGASQYKEGNRIFAEALLSPYERQSAQLLLQPAGGRPVYIALTNDTGRKISSLINTAGLIAVMDKKPSSLTENSSGKLPEIFLAEKNSGVRNRNIIKISETVFFHLFIIGSADMSCFSKVKANSHYLSIYRVEPGCL